jgi:hypothetical protein
MEKWGRMLEPRSRDAGGNIQTWRINPEKVHKLSRRAFKGIPDRWRSAAWLALIGNFAHADRDQLVALSIEYREALEKHSPYDIQIDLGRATDYQWSHTISDAVRSWVSH